MLSPPSESPVFVTLILDKVAVISPETEIAFSSVLVDVKSPLSIVSSVVISFIAEYVADELLLLLFIVDVLLFVT